MSERHGQTGTSTRQTATLQFSVSRELEKRQEATSLLGGSAAAVEFVVFPSPPPPPRPSYRCHQHPAEERFCDDPFGRPIIPESPRCGKHGLSHSTASSRSLPGSPLQSFYILSHPTAAPRGLQNQVYFVIAAENGKRPQGHIAAQKA